MNEINIKEEMENKIPEIEKESKIIIGNILTKIKKFNPYELLSKYMSFITKNSALNPFDISNDVELKFGIESMQMLLTCIEEKEFENNEFIEKNFGEIVNNIKKLFSLESQYAMAVSFKFEDNLKNEGEYIFENIINMNVTGRRYPCFENIHHIKILKPVELEIEEIYGMSIENIIKGLDNFRNKYTYGLKDAMDNLKILMQTCENVDLINSKLQKLEKIIETAFLLENHNVEKETKWPKSFIEIFSNNLGDNKSFCKDISIINFMSLRNTIKSKPIIKIGKHYYNLSISRLLDDFDKNILKDIYKKKYNEKENIKKRIANNCEIYTADLFKEIFPTATILVNNYYKEGKNYIENDLLLEYNNILLIIEVKAGNFTPEVAIKDIDSHKKTLYDLIERADLQSERFLKDLKNQGQLKIFDSNNKKAKLKKEINFGDYKRIFKIVITLEGFNEIAARAEKIGILKMHNNTIACSIDDLEVYADYFKNSPIEFSHYLMKRFKSTESTLIDLNDELDHLGLYIENNDYSLTAYNLSSDYNDVKSILWEEPRKIIDNYYNEKSFQNKIDKPKQKLPYRLDEILNYLNTYDVNNAISFFSEILNCKQKEREQFEKYIEEMIVFYKQKNRPKYMGVKLENTVFISCIVENNKHDLNILLKDFYANMKIGNETQAYAMIVVYDINDKLNDLKIYSLTSDDKCYNSLEIEQLANCIKKQRLSRTLINKKIGRNEKCPCGSQLKYKKCCGKNR